MPIFIISILIQLGLVIHIIKTGRSTTWIWIIVMIPLVGSLAYLLLELIPELANSRTGRRARRDVGAIINADKDLKAAADELSQADTVENRGRLAAECFKKNMFSESRELYAKCLTGIHATDPDLMFGLASCDFELSNFSAAKTTLDDLIEKNPDYKNQEAHLLYARTLDNLGDAISARHEYETLHEYYSGPAASYHYAQFLQAQGEDLPAREIYRQIVEQAERSGRHYNDLYKDIIRSASSWLDE